MLAELHVENLGVIERLELVLGPGLTALTGETGAGKTMLVEAIELLVGGRADSSMVRTGAVEARVDGRFVLPDDREIVLTRVIPSDGRSRAYLDGRPTTVAGLADATASLVDLHGQHAHQSLLSAATQRAALDRFASVDLEPLRQARAHLTEIDAALATLGGDERARAREIDLLRFQLAELDAAGIEDLDEDDQLAREEATLADAVAHRAAGAAALGALVDDGAARDLLGQVIAELGDRSPYQMLASRFVAALAELDDAASELRAVAESIDEDPERLAAVRERRQALRDLCRKYGDGLGEVMEFHASVAERLAELEGFERSAAELEERRAAAVESLGQAARRVGERRREMAPVLAAAVRDRLRTLAMGDADLAVAVGAVTVGTATAGDAGASTDDLVGDLADAAGDRVEFLLAANPGSPLLPLTRVASGGELARAMLALRLALLDGSNDQRATTPTLVFDEVDAGIGGAAATAVGEALADLARGHQVLVVTHLAQVAALADRHVVVTKAVNDGVTTATAVPVTGTERIDEVARMLSGEATDEARTHAGALLGSPGSRSARGHRGRR